MGRLPEKVQPNFLYQLRVIIFGKIRDSLCNRNTYTQLACVVFKMDLREGTGAHKKGNP